MSSLVSDFIINPVLRQARRFSAGFAADEPPRLQHRRSGSDGDSGAILEGDEDGRPQLSSNAAITHGHIEAALPVRAAVSNSSSPDRDGVRATLENDAIVESSSDASAEPTQRPHTLSSDAALNATTRAIWPLIETPRSTPLPEDDGMGELRRRIHGIRLMDVPQNSKAQMVHQLLIENYKTLQHPSGAALAVMRPESPSARSTVSGPPDASEPTGPLHGLMFWNPLGDGPAPLNLPLTEDDLRPTYAPSRPPTDDVECSPGQKQEEEEEEEGEGDQRALGCEHYRRNVKLQCASCERWYSCRFCHDAVEDHVLPRQQTKHMLCMLCGCAQKASDSCIGCGQSAAYYYCGICKLWNDDPNKSIYHCADCGLCRVGQGLGKDFFHCKKCMACISLGGDHKCIERSTDCDCPICSDYLFNSPKPVVFMQCGHSIHRHCFEEHMKSSYKCPLCNKSCINMEYQFRNYDMAILTQPMPAEYCDTRAIISCNDCRAKSQTAYHWLGLKCTVCQSYNTTELQLLNLPGAESEGNGNAIIEQQQQPVPLDAAFLAHELRQRTRAASAARREREREQQQIETDRAAAAALSTSPSYSPAFLLRLLHRTATPVSPTPSLPPPFSEAEERAVPPLSSSPSPRPLGLATAFESPSAAAAAQARHGHGLAVDESDDEEDEEDDDMLDLFWGRDRDHERGNAITSAESAVGFDDEDEGESSSEEDDCDDEDDDDEEDEEEGIMLVGHR